ncbi:PEPxxWA-CTERM sorting domain-containing protein [Phenylobacterium sp.]|jgi:hypothetical protein|uniref:PEPxxWA-CTERM sorting domain-containing protein n=1 Tax=Phenylobacterium sp. TaxID=1871053 RepID=UPI002E2F0CEE|nr:PEPxxWA-CTERM sorting domain-containing protein [Phenylobacterium sp.]HEX3365599.1 PEPxxWA-CTERM sorting domain-containing protein [Phenylobacterium sp.]
MASKLSLLASVVVLSVGALTAGAANAALTFTIGTQVSSPIAQNDFEQMCCSTFPTNTVYSQGGVSVQFVGGGTVLTNVAPDGSFAFYTPGEDGYFDITLTGGGTFNELSLRAVGLWSPDGGAFEYEGLNNGNFIGGGGVSSPGFSAPEFLTFSGGTMNELRIQGQQFNFPLVNAAAASAVSIDDIKIGIAGVPEPATWALTIFGFGGVGGAMRRRRALFA